MPRSIWKGSISFGLVNVPVGLYSATHSEDVHFNQFEEKSKKRVHNKRVAEGTDREVDYDDIVKGYEVSKGKFVMVTPEELEAVEPGPSRTIDIEDFIDFTEIDPIHFKRAYYLAPEGDRGADKPYALLREAMNKSGKVAIGRFVMRGKQYLGCIRPSGSVLVLETMYFPDEVRDPKDLDVPGKLKLTDKELKIAQQLVDSLASPWKPDRYHDTYRERVLELLKAKAKGKGKELDLEKPEPRGEVTDLMAALEASISDIRDRRKTKKATTKKATSRKKAAPKKRAPARKAS